MSNLRKLLAIFLVLYLVLGGASSVFAEASEAPEAAEVEEINETEEIPATVPEEAPQQPEENSSNNEVEEILLGLPLGMAGQETESTGKAREFGQWLGQQTNLPLKIISEKIN